MLRAAFLLEIFLSSWNSDGHSESGSICVQRIYPYIYSQYSFFQLLMCLKASLRVIYLLCKALVKKDIQEQSRAQRCHYFRRWKWWASRQKSNNRKKLTKTTTNNTVTQVTCAWLFSLDLLIHHFVCGGGVFFGFCFILVWFFRCWFVFVVFLLFFCLGLWVFLFVFGFVLFCFFLFSFYKFNLTVYSRWE